MLLNIPQYTGWHPPLSKNYASPNVSSAEVGELCSKVCSVPYKCKERKKIPDFGISEKEEDSPKDKSNVSKLLDLIKTWYIALFQKYFLKRLPWESVEEKGLDSLTTSFALCLSFRRLKTYSSSRT